MSKLVNARPIILTLYAVNDLDYSLLQQPIGILLMCVFQNEETTLLSRMSQWLRAHLYQ